MFQQQGDVLIVAAKIPGKAKKKNSYILAEGEVTGASMRPHLNWCGKCSTPRAWHPHIQQLASHRPFDFQNFHP